jgi:hypothetical protein
MFGCGAGANQPRAAEDIEAGKIRAWAWVPVAGGDVPARLLGEPRDRRLEEEPIALDQEGGAARSRAESEADFGLELLEQDLLPDNSSERNS